MKKPHLSPVFFLTLSYIGGILLADYLRLNPLSLLIFLFVVVLFLIIHLFQPFGLSFGRFFPGFSSYILFFLLGCFLTSLLVSSLSQSKLLPLAREEKEVHLEGRIISEPRYKNNRIWFDLKAESLFNQEEKIRLRENLRVIGENVSENSRSSHLFLRSFVPGERLKLKGKLSLPRNFDSNNSKPASEPSFDYKKYLYRKRIQTVMTISLEGTEGIKGTGGKIEKIRNNSNNYIFALAMKVRKRVREVVSQSLPGPKGSLMLGILIGDTERMPEIVKEDFRRTGLAHIWAVSGMNVGILVGAGWLLLKILRAKPSLQVLILSLAVGFYVLLTGGVPSVLRASLMALILALGWLLGRKKDLVAVLSFSAFLLLLYDPFLLFNISFQLSYAATFALLFLTPFFQEWLGEFPEKLKILMGGTLAAQLGVAPILVYYFNQFSVVSFLANLLAVPAVAPALILGTLASFLSFISRSLAFPFYWLSGIFLWFMLEIAQRLSSIPLASIYLFRPSSITTGLYYLLLFGGTLGLDRILRQKEKGAKGGKERKPRLNLPGAVILILLFLTGILWWQVGLSKPPQELRVTFLDVGQGDSSLIQTPGGEVVLIDGGEDPKLLGRSLESRGIRQIDLLILSHPHADHVGGLVEVVQRYKIGLVLDSGQAHTSFIFRTFLKSIDERNIPYKLARAGSEYKVGEDLRIQIFHPSSEFLEGTDSDINNNSVVLKLTYGKFAVLFPGDAQEEAQSLLLEQKEKGELKEELRATVLKVAHQGSADASGFDFLKEVSPKIAVIMVGKDNPYGHPAPSTLRKLRRIGAQVYRTDQRGDIIIKSDGLRYWVKTEK